jgi:hypothetical protein
VFFVNTASDCLDEFNRTGDATAYDRCLQDSIN